MRRAVARFSVVALALLASAGAAPAGAAFPGRNGVIAFERTTGSHTEIYTVRPDGMHLSRLTRDATNDDYPRFRPGGRRIVFETCRQGRCGLFAMNRDGSHSGRIGYLPDDATAPSVSAHRIAFLRRLDGFLYVTTRDDDGRGLRRLTSELTDGPELSPDGRWVVYVSDFLAYPGPNIYIVGVDGRHRRRLTHGAGPNVTTAEPTFSPDGRRIAFSGVGCVASECTREIWVMDRDGSGRRQVTHGADPAFMPAWSPDGRRIVFARIGDRHTDVHTQLAVVDVATGRERRLLRWSLGEQPAPDWQRLPR